LSYYCVKTVVQSVPWQNAVVSNIRQSMKMISSSFRAVKSTNRKEKMHPRVHFLAYKYDTNCLINLAKNYARIFVNFRTIRIGILHETVVHSCVKTSSY